MLPSPLLPPMLPSLPLSLLPPQVGVLDDLSKFEAGVVNDIIGMGTWRLKGRFKGRRLVGVKARVKGRCVFGRAAQKPLNLPHG